MFRALEKQSKPKVRPAKTNQANAVKHATNLTPTLCNLQ